MNARRTFIEILNDDFAQYRRVEDYLRQQLLRLAYTICIQIELFCFRQCNHQFFYYYNQAIDGLFLYHLFNFFKNVALLSNINVSIKQSSYRRVKKCWDEILIPDIELNSLLRQQIKYKLNMRRLSPVLLNSTEASSKPLPKYQLNGIKLASLPFSRGKERQFSLRTTDRVETYNPLKDRYLQQFFRRDTRVKQLNTFSSSEVSQEVRAEIQRINVSVKDKTKSSYQNLVEKQQLSRPYLTKRRAQKGHQISQLDKTSPHLRIITEPVQSSKETSEVQISKEQFRSFLLKARARLKLDRASKG